MSDSRARVLGEADWQVLRDVRLEALRESPDSFVASYEEWRQYGEESWKEQVRRARWIVADRDGSVVGVVALGLDHEDPEAAEIFGLWVAAQTRGRRVAWGLVQEVAEQAFAEGRSRLYFWVGSDNAPAVAFASSFGFRPTSQRRWAGADESMDGVEETAMMLPLAPDPRSVSNPRIP